MVKCNNSHDPADPSHPPDTPAGLIPRPGEHLADYVLVYADGSEHRQPIRRRFEVNEAALIWGQRAFAARPHQEDVPLDFRGPYPAGAWGGYQTGVGEASNEPASYWLYALENPYPDREIRAIHLEPSGADRLAVAAITLYEGEEHPLRRRRLESLRVTLPAEMTLDGVEAQVDLGTIARRYAVPSFVPQEWLAAPVAGWGEEPIPLEPTRQVILDVTASADAILQVAGRGVPMQPVFQAGSATSDDGQVLVELLTPRKAWVHVTVEDASTGRPTPARVHFRAPDGRYLPPYGHRHEVNDGWFEDYGADLKLGHTQYAYVDGTFQIELPVVIIPHFPIPYCEVVADLILEKVDGVEIRTFGPHLDDFQMQEWYRFLNCGYRVAAVGGTDKMWAGMPVGGVRTYADLRGEEFTFQNWARAIRAGRTFTTSGPVIGLTVEGKTLGEEIRLPGGGGTLGVEAWAQSVLPFHALQVVVNGRVVASETSEAGACPELAEGACPELAEGARRLTLKVNLRLEGSSWVAARCVSRYKVWHGWPIPIAAHTSPVYVAVGEQRQFSPSDATYMMTMLDGGMAWLDTLSIPADPERQARIRGVFEQAQEALHQRLHAAGRDHSHWTV